MKIETKYNIGDRILLFQWNSQIKSAKIEGVVSIISKDGTISNSYYLDFDNHALARNSYDEHKLFKDREELISHISSIKIT